MEYIKLHAYHEVNQSRGDLRHTHNVLRENIDAEDHSESEDRVRIHLQHRRRRSSISSMTSEGTSSISKASLLTKAAAAAAAVATPMSTENKAPNLKETGKPSAAIELPSTEPVLMMGVMEVYPSDEEDSGEEYEYITETETESEEEEEDGVEVIEAKHQHEQPSKANKDEPALHEHVKEAAQSTLPKATDTVQDPAIAKKQAESTHVENKQDDKVDRLKSAYQEIKKDRQGSPSSLLTKQTFNPQRRVSFIEDLETPIDISRASPSRTVDSTNALNKRSNDNSTLSMYATRSSNSQKTRQPQVEQRDDDNDKEEGKREDSDENYDGTSESAAFELDDMLRELDSKRIARNSEESTRYHHHPDIRPTASISSPSLLQQQQQQRRSIPSQYYQQPTSYQNSRRMSTIETSRGHFGRPGSIQSNSSSSYMDLYDPFNSLSSKETGTISTKSGSIESTATKMTPPSVQLMHERMLKEKQTGYHDTVSSSSSSGGSVRSLGQQAYTNDRFIQDYYNVGSKASAKIDENQGHFIDFGKCACACII